MSDDDYHGEHEDDHADGDFDAEYATERTTAPQGPYSTRDVGVGFAVLLVGVVLVFGVPLLVLGI